jgi:hypothetical protein
VVVVVVVVDVDAVVGALVPFLLVFSNGSIFRLTLFVNLFGLCFRFWTGKTCYCKIP